MLADAEQAQSFSERVIIAMRRRRPRLTVTLLAKKLGYARETVSRAINQGEFPEVQAAIAAYLGLK